MASMAMDDDDELNFFRNYAGGGSSITAPRAPRRASPNPFDALNDRDTPAPNRAADEDETPLQQLIRHWMNERHAPDLLPAQQVLLAGLLDHIHRQTDTVQTLRADPSSSEEDHFRIMLVQTEIERVKFIVRSYVRTRLFKIEKYARFITMNEELQVRMTATEQEHARRHADLTDEHFFNSVLQSLPPPQRALDEEGTYQPNMSESTHFIARP
ncbi:hypothetical protein HWV62_20312 [Athelia sp. TMB]|nr:hypothetical protein HWV62_20312 [Athelia sp. TMB]